jgi:hypothetical protein
MRRGRGSAVRGCSHQFSQRLPQSWFGWNRIFCVHAGSGCKRGVHCVPPIPDGQYSGRRSDVLHGRNGMDGRQAQRRADGRVRLGCACGCIGGWNELLEVWFPCDAWRSGLKRWSSRRHGLFPWLRGSACGGGGHSDARAGWCFGSTTDCASLWRMCFALFIASGSFFMGRQQIFPAFIRKSNVLLVLTILPLVLLSFLADPRALHEGLRAKA